MENEFPPNSHSQRDERRPRQAEKPSEKKDVARVTTGKVIQRKKPLRKRFAEAFTGDDHTSVIEYVFLEVLVDGVKDLVADVATTTIERALYPGEPGGGHRRRHGSRGGYTSYNRMSTSRRDPRDDRRSPRRERGRDSSDPGEWILDSRVEANEVLDNLIELISKYDVATKRDLLSLLGEPHLTTDEDWGWFDLRGSRVHRVREGYLLDLPRPESLD